MRIFKKIKEKQMISIRPISKKETSLILPLCDLLIDSVHNGASVGFLAPLSTERAERYWESVFTSLSENLLLWAAEDQEKVVGSVQLALCEKENGLHRAAVQKLFVFSSERGKGIASRLLAAVEVEARRLGRSLLVLDTESGSKAEAVYRHLGWQAAGVIPGYACDPSGRLHAAAWYYKQIG